MTGATWEGLKLQCVAIANFSTLFLSAEIANDRTGH